MTAHQWAGEPRYAIDRPIMTQEWRSLAYLQWPYDPAIVQPLLPEGLDVDTYDEMAWVGLVPFHMGNTIGCAAMVSAP